MSWAETEFETLDLGDTRLNNRAIELIEDFSAKPTASIAQACGDWADTQAAYRFFDKKFGGPHGCTRRGLVHPGHH